MNIICLLANEVKGKAHFSQHVQYFIFFDKNKKNALLRNANQSILKYLNKQLVLTQLRFQQR